MLDMKSPRIRFNWGYHDGAQTVLRHWRRHNSHFDKIYFQGYQAGLRDAQSGTYVEDSTQAWKERKPINALPWRR